MTGPEWEDVKRLFHEALARPAEGRAAWMASECSADPAIRREVERLVTAHLAAGSFIETPVADLHAESARTPGTKVGSWLGPYRLESLLGAGGMGEVYRAVHADLGRAVAIKVVGRDEAAAHDRLRREARNASRLNHPNICTIHHVGDHDGRPYIVMQLVDGRPLSELIPPDGLPGETAAAYGIQILDALAHAHAHRVIHRDLKSANVMVRADGQLTLLDFGLARQLEGVATGSHLVPASAVDLTAAGGTLPYMAPEILRGQTADTRTDVWAFGVLLHEMVTGRLPFSGQTAYEVGSAILHDPPAALPDDVPSALRSCIIGCLEKEPADRPQSANAVKLQLEAFASRRVADVPAPGDSQPLRENPAERYQSADAVLDAIRHNADVKVALADVEEDARSGAAVAPTRPRARHGLIIATLGGLVIVTAISAVSVVLRSNRAGDPPAPRVVPLTTLTGTEMAATFSPDGDQVAFVWDGENQDNFDIYVRMIGASEVRRLTIAPGFDAWPAWSPDGRQIAYVRDPNVAGSQLRLMTSLGGSDRTLIDLPGLRRVAWSPDSRYIAAGVYGSEQAVKGDTRENNGIYLIPVAGGEPRPITTSKPPGSDQAPAFSPDGRRLAYASCRGTFFRANCDVHLLDLDPSFAATAPSRRLTHQASFDISSLAWSRDGTSVIYHVADSGRLHYLWRVRVDGNHPPDRIETAGLNSAYPATASARDRLAYTRVLEDIDIYRFQSGSSSRSLLSSSFQESDPEFSPDGRRIAFCSNRSGEDMEVWVAAADGTGVKRLTHGPGRWQCSPRWSPDGQQIAFDSRAGDGSRHIWIVDADGGIPRQITRDPGDQVIPSWSRDGRWIYYSWAQGAGRDIWRTRVAGGAKQRLTSDGGGAVGLESADGKSLLYLTMRASPLLAVPLTGGPPREVVACVDGTAFAVGPERVYYVACGSGEAEVHIRNPVTGDDRRLGTLEKYERGWVPRQRSRDREASSFTISPDGSAVLYRRTTSVSMDLMLIENFR